MRAKVLIIEDEPDLARLTTLYLEKEGVECLTAGEGESALALTESQLFDLILLDINLPGMDGFEFLQAFRKNHSTPVIIVSAREADEDVILGLGIGADEFVTKPVSPRVLTARVRALLRRGKLTSPPSPWIRFGPYTLDPEAYLLKKGDEKISLSGREFDVLIFLVKQAGKAFSPQEIYHQVWGQVYGDPSPVGVYLQRLRKKLEFDPSAPVFLETVPGKGYRFNPLFGEGQTS